MDRRTFLQHFSAIPAISLPVVGSTQSPAILGHERSDYCLDGSEEVFEMVIGDSMARLLNSSKSLIDCILSITKTSRSLQARSGRYMPLVRIHNQYEHLKPPGYQYCLRVLGVTVHTSELLPEFVATAQKGDLKSLFAQFDQWSAEYEKVTTSHQEIWAQVCPSFPSTNRSPKTKMVVTN